MRYFLILSLLLIRVTMKSQTTFEKTFGGLCQNGGYSVSEVADSGFVFTGYWSNGVGCGNTLFHMKTNKNGIASWTKQHKKVPGSLFAVGFSLIKTSDAGFAMVGSSTPDNINNQECYIVKTNSNGDTLWTKLYGDENTVFISNAYSIKQTSDNGFILAGWKVNGNEQYPYLIKTNSSGDSLWTKTYKFGVNRPGTAHSVVDITGGYVILGHLAENNLSGNRDILIIKTNLNGDTLWSKSIGGINDEQGYCVQKTPDNGLIICGATKSFGAGGYDAYLVKVNSNGLVQWSKTFGGLDDEFANEVSLTSDGGFIIAGSAESFGSNGREAYLIKTDSVGNLHWYKTFGGTNADYAYSVKQTFDGGYVFLGIRGNNVYLVKTSSNGFIIGIHEILSSKSLDDLTIIPNPTNANATLVLNSDYENYNIVITNSFGQIMQTHENISGQTFVFERNNLTNGIYFIKVVSKNKNIQTKKIILTD
jgi:hypothetical protein